MGLGYDELESSVLGEVAGNPLLVLDKLKSNYYGKIIIIIMKLVSSGLYSSTGCVCSFILKFAFHVTLPTLWTRQNIL